MTEGDGDLDPLSHALAVAGDLPVHRLAEAEFVEEFRGATTGGGTTRAGQSQHPLHEREACLSLVVPVDVGAVAEVLPGPRYRRRDPEEEYLAVARS